MNVLGIMSGTSIDGVDIVLCSAKGKKIKFVDAASFSFSPLLQKKLMLASQAKISLKESTLLHYDLGRFYAKEVLKIVKRKKWKIDLVGLHGQTLFHSSGVATCQIGESSFLSQALSCPVVSDFRAADIAAGGKGAPLAGLFHTYIAKERKLNKVAFHNLGGIANLTYISKKQSLSFDTGPANILMDLYCQNFLKIPYDKNGTISQKGVVDIKLLNDMLKHPYFKLRPPKSCGREEFGAIFFKKYENRLKKMKKENALATLLEFTAFTIADAYKKFVPKDINQVILCGGGALNLRLIKRIQFHLSHTKVISVKELNWHPLYIEGAAFAYLAYCRYQNKKLNTKNFSGAKKEICLGKITQ